MGSRSKENFGWWSTPHYRGWWPWHDDTITRSYQTGRRHQHYWLSYVIPFQQCSPNDRLTIRYLPVAGRKSEEEPSFLNLLGSTCTARGLVVGSRQQFEEMNRAVEVNNIKPVLDKQTFKLDQAKEAYQYMWDQKHFGKIAITI